MVPSRPPLHAPKLVCAAAVIGLLLAGSVAADEPKRVRARLEYTRAAEGAACPDADAMRRAVAERLGYDPFEASATDVVTVSIASADDGLVADVERLDTRGESLGKRRLESVGDDCQELATAVALAICIAIDPTSGLPSPKPTASAQPSSTSLPNAPSSASAAPNATASATATATASAPPSAPVVLAAGAGVLGSLGAAPGPSFGIAAHVRVRRDLWSIALEGRADLPSSVEAADGGTVSAALLLGRVAPCLHWRLLFGCALISAGALAGASSNVAEPANQTTPYVSAGLRGGVELTFGERLALRGHLDLEAPMTRTTLRLNGEPVWTTPPIAGSLGAMLLVSFP